MADTRLPSHIPEAGDEREQADPGWVRELTGARLSEVQSALDEAHRDLSFRQAIAEAHATSGRSFYAQIRAPYELFALVRILKPRQVVEIGVSSGVSSAYFLKALKANGAGTLHSIDWPTPQKGAEYAEGKDSPVALPPGRASGWAVPAGVREGWDLRIGKGRELLPPLLKELDRVDLFLHDDEHTFANATWELQSVDPKVPPGGVFLADNTEWLEGALDRFAESKGGRASLRRGLDLAGFRQR